MQMQGEVSLQQEQEPEEALFSNTYNPGFSVCLHQLQQATADDTKDLQTNNTPRAHQAWSLETELLLIMMVVIECKHGALNQVC